MAEARPPVLASGRDSQDSTSGLFPAGLASLAETSQAALSEWGFESLSDVAGLDAATWDSLVASCDPTDAPYLHSLRTDAIRDHERQLAARSRLRPVTLPHRAPAPEPRPKRPRPLGRTRPSALVRAVTAPPSAASTDANPDDASATRLPAAVYHARARGGHGRCRPFLHPRR